MNHVTFLYARKSSEEDERQAPSLDAQEMECRQFASRQAIPIDHLIRESHSARKPGRPLFEAMLRQAEALRRRGKSVRILCCKPDRLLRNIGDYARVNELMEQGVEFLFVSGSYPNNAQGKMAFGINVVFAKFYVDNLSEDVKRGMRQKVSQGGWPHRAPLGYRNVEGGVEIDPNTGPLVRQAFRWYDTGEYSLATLAKALHGAGLGGRRLGKPLVKNVLATRILANPFYCGLLRYHGEFFAGGHEPLIPVALFERVQARLRGRSRPKRVRRDFRFRGLFHCGRCGCAVVGDLKKGVYTYYRCSHKRGPCSEGYVREEVLNHAVREAVTATLLLPEPVIDVLKQIGEQLASGESDATLAAAALKRQAGDTAKRLTTLLDLRLAGQVGEAEYLAKREELVMEQARLKERISGFERPTADPRSVLDWFIETCRKAAELLETGADAEIRTLLQIVGSNYRLTGGEVDFEPVEPFILAAQAGSRPQWWNNEDEVRTQVARMRASQILWQSLVTGQQPAVSKTAPS